LNGYCGRISLLNELNDQSGRLALDLLSHSAFELAE
jgi:hypothetical protein